MMKKKIYGVSKNLFWLFACLGVMFLMNTFIGHRVVVQGESMYPTLKEGESLVLDKLTYRFSPPERFDIVVFPGTENEYGVQDLYIKRIVGLPGEEIEIKDGSVYIDGKKLDESSYLKKDVVTEGFDEDYDKVKLKKNEYYCLGDNREYSTDSRFIGPVSFSKKNIVHRSLYKIIGRAPARMWPLKRAGIF